MKLNTPFVLAAVLLAGCASKYYDARFTPQTTEAPATGNTAGAHARSIVSFVGVRRKDAKTGAPPAVEFRMRIENLGTVPCTLQQHSLQLLSASLEPFGAAQLSGDDPPVIAAGASSNYQVLFPVAQGHTLEATDLRTLNLRWSIAFDGEELTNGMTFERQVPIDMDPSFSFGIGFWH